MRKGEMDSLDWRTLVIGLINGTYKENEAIEIAEGKKCDCCGYVDLEEYMHENEDGVYCETCWEAREEYGIMGNM